MLRSTAGKGPRPLLILALFLVFSLTAGILLAGFRSLPSTSLIASPLPLSGVGSGSDPEFEGCSIYILDPVRDLGQPACDLTSTRVWPFASASNKLQAAGPLQPWEHQHAVNYWTAEAIKVAGVRAPSLHAADLIFLHSHCYEQWRLGWWWERRGHNLAGLLPESDQYLRRTMRLLQTWPQWRESNGSRFVVSPFHPSTYTETVNAMRPCNSSVFSLVATHAQFCTKRREEHERQGLILPFVTEFRDRGPQALAGKRDMLLFYKGGCADPAARARYAWGKLQRLAFVTATKPHLGADVDVNCGCDVCPRGMNRNEMMARMQRSVFCAVLAGDAQTSRRQAESVLRGCIPVYIGPGFHTLPLAHAIDHASFSVFIRVRNVTWTMGANGANVGANGPDVGGAWYLDAPVPEAEIASVRDLGDVVGYLRKLPPQVVAAKQAALAREYHKFSYRARRGEALSGAQRIVLGRLCERARQWRARADVG